MQLMPEKWRGNRPYGGFWEPEAPITAATRPSIPALGIEVHEDNCQQWKQCSIQTPETSQTGESMKLCQHGGYCIPVARVSNQ